MILPVFTYGVADSGVKSLSTPIVRFVLPILNSNASRPSIPSDCIKKVEATFNSVCPRVFWPKGESSLTNSSRKSFVSISTSEATGSEFVSGS